MLVSVVTALRTRSCFTIGMVTVHAGIGNGLKTEITTEEEEPSVNGWFLLRLLFYFSGRLLFPDGYFYTPTSPSADIRPHNLPHMWLRITMNQVTQIQRRPSSARCRFVNQNSQHVLFVTSSSSTFSHQTWTNPFCHHSEPCYCSASSPVVVSWTGHRRAAVEEEDPVCWADGDLVLMPSSVWVLTGSAGTIRVSVPSRKPMGCVLCIKVHWSVG